MLKGFLPGALESRISIYKLVVFVLIWICFVDFTVQNGRSETWLKRVELTCVL